MSRSHNATPPHHHSPPSPRQPATPSEIRSLIHQTGIYTSSHTTSLITEIHSTTTIYPTLRPTVHIYHSNTTHPSLRLALRGVLPITYKTLPYKIPVHIWLPPHPATPPLPFVVPTSEMAFRNQHPHVSPADGRVFHPVLTAWSPSSTLVSLLDALVASFSEKTPVYSLPPKQSLPRRTPSLPLPCTTPLSQPSARRAASVRPPSIDRGPARRERTALLAALSARLSAALADRHAHATHLIEERRSAAHKLDLCRQQSVQACAERAVLADRVGMLERRREGLKRWVGLHPASPEGAHVDVVCVPRHALRLQELQCRAGQAAFGDAMRVLDDAVARNLLELDVYLRLVRAVARKQFFGRVMLKKVRERIGEIKDEGRRRERGRGKVDGERIAVRGGEYGRATGLRRGRR